LGDRINPHDKYEHPCPQFGCARNVHQSLINGPEGRFRAGLQTLLARTRVGAFVVADKSDTRKSREGDNDNGKELAELHLEALISGCSTGESSMRHRVNPYLDASPCERAVPLLLHPSAGGSPATSDRYQRDVRAKNAGVPVRASGRGRWARRPCET
jgi:hypothetical protein